MRKVFYKREMRKEEDAKKKKTASQCSLSKIMSRVLLNTFVLLGEEKWRRSQALD